MSKRVYEILIPVNANDNDTEGTLYSNLQEEWFFTPQHNKIFEDKLIAVSGGLSKYPEIDGVWDEEVKRFAEKIIPYRVICTAQEIDGLAEFAKTHYKQLAICVFDLGTAKIY